MADPNEPSWPWDEPISQRPLPRAPSARRRLWRGLTPVWVVPLALALIDVVVSLVGLGTGVASVSRRTEWILFALAALSAWVSVAVSIFGLVSRPRRRLPAVAAVAAVFGLAFALAVAVGRANQPGSSGRTSTSIITLTSAQRTTLAREARQLPKAGHPELARTIASLLATGGVIGAGLLPQTASNLEQTGAIGAQAASTLLSAAIRARAQLSVTPTLRIDRPMFSLGGVRF